MKPVLLGLYTLEKNSSVKIKRKASNKIVFRPYILVSLKISLIYWVLDYSFGCLPAMLKSCNNLNFKANLTE